MLERPLSANSGHSLIERYGISAFFRSLPNQGNLTTLGRDLGGDHMSWGFEEGKVYSRRADLHAKFGGQQQGGIVKPSQHPLVIIVTGKEGLEHGYADRTRDDGVFEYFGEGQVGDMVMLLLKKSAGFFTPLKAVVSTPACDRVASLNDDSGGGGSLAAGRSVTIATTAQAENSSRRDCNHFSSPNRRFRKFVPRAAAALSPLPRRCWQTSKPKIKLNGSSAVNSSAICLRGILSNSLKAISDLDTAENAAGRRFLARGAETYVPSARDL